MNKTVTINISGIIFHIEEDAFDVLSQYLAQIKTVLGTTVGGAEALSDIESRIAELLQERLGPSKQVIMIADVEHVREVMGRPEDFGTGTEDSAGVEPPTEKVRRRLFRNPDERVLGGVCSGLAAYFDVETVWVRLAMFILVFFGGLSVWVYLILWIVIPEARTTADKLAMRGESANLNNIYRSVREEAEEVKNRLNKYGNDLNRAYGERVRSNLSSALVTIFGIIGRVIGFFLLLLGTAFLLGYLGVLTGISIVDRNHEFSTWRQVLIDSPSDYTLGIIAFVLIAGVPVFMLLYGGIKLLFRIRYSNRWLTLGLGMLWISGVILGIFVTFNTLKEFRESSTVRQNIKLQGVGDTVIVKMRHGAEVVREWNFDNQGDLEEALERNKPYQFGMKGNEVFLIGRPGLDVIESAGDSVELLVSYVADGADKRSATENARNISYGYIRQGNTIIFDEVFRVVENSKYRNQEVDLRLRLPVGTVIFFDESVKNLLDDVDNVTNTWDSDMVNRRWKMTSRGLACIDCADIDDRSQSKHEGEEHTSGSRVIINKDGIKVDDKDARVRISNRGITIHTHDKKHSYRVEKE